MIRELQFAEGEQNTTAVKSEPCLLNENCGSAIEAGTRKEALVGTKIRLATTEADRHDAFRFRYEIYVKEMKRFQKYADHDKQIIEEPLDRTGHILIASDDEGHTVGTVRFNIGVDENFGLYEELYRLREFDRFYPSSVSITTKLMVAPDYRHSMLPLRLAVRSYVSGIAFGCAFDCIDCNKHLVPFFNRLGYRRVFPEVVHPEYGRVVPMVLALLDINHLEKVRSPFAKHTRKFADTRDSVTFFREGFLPNPSTFHE